MESEKPYIIPTRFKSKISHELSFPIGAERISQALAETPQFAKLILHFNSERWRSNGDRWLSIKHGYYEIFRVSYSGRRAQMAAERLAEDGESLWSEWQLDVFPVPRALRHRFHEYILETALPQVKDWLRKRNNPGHSGEDVLSFIYDEHKDELTSETRFDPKPLRV